MTVRPLMPPCSVPAARAASYRWDNKFYQILKNTKNMLWRQHEVSDQTNDPRTREGRVEPGTSLKGALSIKKIETGLC